MSFTRFLYPDPLHTREWYMQVFIEVTRELGLPEKAASVLAAMCCFQEVGVKDGDAPFERRIWCPANPTNEPSSLQYDHDSESNDGRSVGICQQQRGPNGELWWGTVANEMDPRKAIRTFMSRLPKGFHANDAEAANNFVQAVQQSGVPHAYAQWWGDAIRLYNEVKAGVPITVPPPLPDVTPTTWQETVGPWTGDPVWLADVLRAEGVPVVETPGWRDSGHGDMGALWGVVCHHTGNSNSTWESIRNGRPDLAGPLSQVHLRRDGVAEIVAAGVCWHAGTGGAPGLPLHTGNQKCIGIEAQNNGTEGWSPAQYESYVRICAAFCRRIGVNASHVVSHQEYDDYDPSTDEGKWDPGLLDMNKFRKDVQARIDSKPTTSEEDELMAALSTEVTSISPVRELGETTKYQVIDLIRAADAAGHLHRVVLAAAVGDPVERARLERVAAGDPTKYPDRAYDIRLAGLLLQAIDDGTLTPTTVQAAATAAEVAVAAVTPPLPVVTTAPEAPVAPAPAEPVSAGPVCSLGDGKACVVDGGPRCSLSDDGICVATPK